jgi:hypothetical protein
LNNRGQFSIIAALLVAVILISTVIVTYSTIRNSPISDQPQVLSAIDETNFAIKQIFGFTVGYYGSVLKVTGNSSYARMLALNYLYSGLVNIANMHPEWGTSFRVNESKTDLHTHWFTKTSYSTGNLAVMYNLTGLRIYRITYQTSCKLSIQIIKTNSTTQACLNVSKDENEPLINLGKQNFKFYCYKSAKSAWELISPSTDPLAFANGTCLIDIPSGVDPYAYVIQVEDSRGIIVSASSFSRYTCTLAWNSTLYAATDATIVVELLQNGTMRWLGQNLNLTTQAKPIPPIPVKAIHVNQTINGIEQEVLFQIEEWASDYKVPLSLASNASVFSNRNMLVFLINRNVTKVTIWWNGSDTATQTPNAYANKYFTVDTNQRTLSNSIMNLQIDFSSQDGVQSFKVISTKGASKATAVLMRINQDIAHYGHSEPMYAITNGPVRVVLQHEVEWPDGGVAGGLSPNVYAHIVLTLPANATYYTYQLRLIFINSSQTRTIEDLCPIQINAPIFGCTTQGSDYSSVNANNTYGSLFTSPPATVIAKNIVFYGRSSSGTANVKCLIVRHSDLKIIAITNPVTITTTAQWWTATFSSPPTLSPNTSYVLMIIPNNTVIFYRTTGSTNQGHYDTSNSYSSPTDPTDASHNNRQYSIYCAYTTSQTENGTLNGYPIVSNESGVFYNSSEASWQHHWSQIIYTSTQGVGMMFRESSNQMLYVFDGIVGNKTGALNVNAATGTIELLPVAMPLDNPVSFQYPLDVLWYGAVVTFDGTTPIYNSSNQSGLWITVEYPPTITVATES